MGGEEKLSFYIFINIPFKHFSALAAAILLHTHDSDGDDSDDGDGGLPAPTWDVYLS